MGCVARLRNWGHRRRQPLFLRRRTTDDSDRNAPKNKNEQKTSRLFEARDRQTTTTSFFPFARIILPNRPKDRNNPKSLLRVLVLMSVTYLIGWGISSLPFCFCLNIYIAFMQKEKDATNPDRYQFLLFSLLFLSKPPFFPFLRRRRQIPHEEREKPCPWVSWFCFSTNYKQRARARAKERERRGGGQAGNDTLGEP